MQHIHRNEKSGFKQLTTIIILGALSACGPDSSSTTAIVVATAPPASSTPTETADALTFYTQADAGARSYEMNCAVCHGANLEGTTLGPLLSGTNFVQRWGEQTPAMLL